MNPPENSPREAPPASLREWFGDIDIYLFDQFLKNRFTPEMRILDAGCGGGRNLVYFLRNGFDVSAIDLSPEAVASVRRVASILAPHLPDSNFRVEAVEAMTFDDLSFDAVISSAVLHFATDERQFEKMLLAMWRALRRGGIFFARLASDIGIEGRVRRIEGRRYSLPDGSDRFLVDEEMLARLSEELGGEWLEPLKTVNVQNMRCMTTWCLRKR
ncbi:MAG: class I SAM-dependent methyltransferase [Acidobacteria bacterium]|nr:class I SAM-dependent methyltransferase [Acidobacteriota bacterium]